MIFPFTRFLLGLLFARGPSTEAFEFQPQDPLNKTLQINAGNSDKKPATFQLENFSFLPAGNGLNLQIWSSWNSPIANLNWEASQ